MTCICPECDRPAVSRGLCRSHRKQQDSGRVLTPLRPYQHRRTVAALSTGIIARAVVERMPKGGHCARLMIPDGAEVDMGKVAAELRKLADAVEAARLPGVNLAALDAVQWPGVDR